MKRGVALAAVAALTLVSVRAGSQTFDAQGRAIDGDTVAGAFRLLGVDAIERRPLCRSKSGC